MWRWWGARKESFFIFILFYFFFFFAFVRRCQLKCPQPWAQRQQWQPIHFPDELSPAGGEVTSPKVIYGIVDLSFLHLQLFATHAHAQTHTHPPTHITSQCTSSSSHLPFLDTFFSMLYCFYPWDCFDLCLDWCGNAFIKVSENGQCQTWVISSLKYDVIGQHSDQTPQKFETSPNQTGVSDLRLFLRRRTRPRLCATVVSVPDGS